MKGVLADLQHAFRLYLKTPASSALAIVVLAASMAAVTAFLSLWSDLALKPHPGFERSGELITIGQNDGRQLMGVSFNLIERVNEEATAIASIAGVWSSQQYLDRDGERVPIFTELVTSRYFPDIRPRLALGRPFDADDHDANAAPVAILSDAFWQSEYGGRPDVLGERLTIHGPNMVMRTPDGEARAAEKFQPYEIVGVLAPDLSGTFLPEVAVLMPYEQTAQVLMGDAGAGYRRFPQLSALARLASGASIEGARTELEGRYGDTGPETGLGVMPQLRLDAIRGIVRNLNTHRDILRQVRLFLAGSVLLALVAACNVSLFLLSRAPGRRRELSVRMAVGAPLKRLSRQLVTESSLLVIAGTLLGLFASLWLAVAIRGLAFLQQAQWREVTPFDWRVLGLVAVFMLLLTMLVSLAPIAGLRKIGIATASRSVTARAGLAQQIAGTAQVIVAAVIGGAALAFAWTLVALISVDRGFSAQGVYAVMLEPPESGRFELGEDVLLAEREHRRDVIAALPGIDAVAFGTLLPGMARNTLMMQLAPPDDPEDRFAVSMHAADSAYFDVLKVSLRDGRLPEANDRDVVINATLARRLWGRTNVAGEVIPRNPPPGANAPQWTVLGVIDDIAYGHPSDEPEPLIYAISNSAAAFESILIKSSASIADIQRTLQGKIDDGELAIRINSIQSIEALADRVLAADRARTMLTVAAAALVVLLAGFGFFGTQRFLVAAGRREYAILAALGAGPRALGRLVLRRGLLQGVPGLVLGSILAFIVVAWMRDDFFSTAVSPSAVTALVAIGIAVLLLGATIGPASQARNTEPAPLLREE